LKTGLDQSGWIASFTNELVQAPLDPGRKYWCVVNGWASLNAQQLQARVIVYWERDFRLSA
jgi:hypothetical protein